jgi:putative ABC transport system permease protein
MRNDLRYALRSLRRTPVFTAVAVLSLALGIGANTAIFSLLDQALLRSLPVQQPDRLVVLHAPKLQLQGTSSSSNHETVYSLAMYREFARRADLFSGTVFRAGIPPVILQNASSDYVSVELVSGNFFEVLGVRASLGRTFTAAEDNQQPVAVLSHKGWVDRFGADSRIVGRTVKLSGLSYTVLGVLPPRFDGVVTGARIVFYVPASMQRQLYPDMDGTRPDTRWVNIMARLQPGVSRERAEEAVQSTWKAILEERLATDGATSATA